MDVIGYVRNERKIGDGQLVANKVFLLGENALENTQNTDDLLLVSFDGRWDLLSMVHAEPGCLAVVRSDIKKKIILDQPGGRSTQKRIRVDRSKSYPWPEDWKKSH